MCRSLLAYIVQFSIISSACICLTRLFVCLCWGWFAGAFIPPLRASHSFVFPFLFFAFFLVHYVVQQIHNKWSWVEHWDVCLLQTIRASSVRSMSSADRLQRTGRSNQRACLPQRLFLMRPVQPSLHPGTAVRSRWWRKRLLSFRLSATAQCAGTRRRRRRVNFSRRADGEHGGTRTTIVVSITEWRSRHSWVDLVGCTVAAARVVRPFLDLRFHTCRR